MARTAPWLFVAALVAGCLSPAAAQQDKTTKTDAPAPYFYIQAADPQLFFKQKDDRNWRRTVALVNKLKPDFLIVCGDLIQADNSAAKWKKPGEIATYEKLAKTYLAGAARLDKSIPLRNVAGNHDVSLQPTPETIAWYEKRFGKAWYAFEHKRSLFIVLESNLIRDPKGASALAKKQMDWLAKTLKEARPKTYIHKTVYMHHPMCLKTVNEKTQYFNIPREIRANLLKQFHEHGVRAVFCGHYHRNAYVKDGDLELITTSSCGAALGKDPLGFRIVKVYADRIEHKYYAFDDIPVQVEFDSPAKPPVKRR